MASNLPVQPIAVIHRLLKAVNEHDLASMVACFASDYLSDPPNHPARMFQGRAQVEKNWAATFEEIPDFRMELSDLVVRDNQAWLECEWVGTRRDQTRFSWKGVFIFTIAGDEIASARIYMEPVEESGLGIDATVRDLTHKEGQE